MTVEHHRPGDVLARSGEDRDRVFLINAGEASVDSGEGSRTLGAGQTVGHLSAISGSRVEETVSVKTRMEAYVLTAADVQEVMRTDKRLADRVKLHLMGRQ